MITLFVFYLHIIAAVAIFTRRWQEGGLSEGILGVGFLALIFSVGWSISTIIMKWLIAGPGFGIWLDRDALSLLLLTIMEGAFFSVQLRRRRNMASRTVVR